MLSREMPSDPTRGEKLVTPRHGERELGPIVYPITPDIHIMRVTNGHTDNVYTNDLLTRGQENTTTIYHKKFANGITNGMVNHELHGRNIATTFLAAMKPSELEHIGLAGNMQLSTAVERRATGMNTPLEFMEHLIPPGGNQQFFKDLGVTPDQVGELGRFAITQGPKREKGDDRPTYRDYKAQILQSLLDDAMIAAKEKNLKKVILVKHTDLDELFEQANRVPEHMPGAKLIQADPFNKIAKEVNRFYDRYCGYWRRQDGSIPQISVYDVDEYVKDII